MAGNGNLTRHAEVDAGTLRVGPAGSLTTAELFSQNTSQQVIDGQLSVTNWQVNDTSTLSGGGTATVAQVLSYNSAAASTFAGVIASSGVIAGVQVNNGRLTLSGANSYQGNTSIAGGSTFTLGGAGVLGGGNYIYNIPDGGALVVNTTSNQVLGGTIYGGGGTVTQMGPGLLALTNGNNSYSGGTTVSGGTLQLGAPGRLGGAAEGGLTVNGGMLDLNGNNLWPPTAARCRCCKARAARSPTTPMWALSGST